MNEHLADAPVTDRIEAYEVWSEHPYGLLLLCGRGVDSLELPEGAGGLLPTPVEFRSSQRWLAPPSPSPEGLRDAETVQHALLTALLRSGLSTRPGDNDEQ